MSPYTAPMSAAAGAVLAVFGGVSHDEIITWTGVLIAVGSAITSAVLAGYHKLRERVRSEDRADRAAVLEDIRAMTRVQVELDQRVQQTQHKLSDLEGLLEKVRCRFPLQDGSARCSDPKCRQNEQAG